MNSDDDDLLGRVRKRMEAVKQPREWSWLRETGKIMTRATKKREKKYPDY